MAAFEFALTPDGQRYQRMAAGHMEPWPFHFRWLVPALVGPSPLGWLLASWGSVAAVSCLTAVWALQAGASPAQAAAAALLYLALPATSYLLRAPVLVDAPAMALTLLAVVAWPVEPRIGAAALILASMAWEKAPLFAALFLWSPLPLLALAVPAASMLMEAGEIRANDPHAATLRAPLLTGLKAHAGLWRHPVIMVAPWGGCLAALWAPSWQLGAALAVSYAQMLLATDTVRLFQTCGPLVAIAAARAVPESALPALVVLSWFNPLRGRGL